jgi:hypothetical protein
LAAADRPAAAVFFGHVRLVALSLPQGNIDFRFVLFEFFKIIS